jgi:hypothetical protein
MIFAVSVLGLLSPMALRAQSTPIVYVAPIEGLIDLGLAPFVRRIVEEAETRGAAAVILKVNTFGGRVDAAVRGPRTACGVRMGASTSSRRDGRDRRTASHHPTG